MATQAQRKAAIAGAVKAVRTGAAIRRAGTLPVPTPTSIETFSGLYMDVLAPDPSKVVLEDIAHALSMTCRFAGHTSIFYSVAEHAVMVSRRIEALGYPREVQLAGLHHDDPEAYILDIPRPMKPLLNPTYEMLTERMELAIAQSIGRGWRESLSHPAVKAADDWAVYVEARYLLKSEGRGWKGADAEPSYHRPMPSVWTGGLSGVEAEGAFLSRHWELT